jgi:hypothetical protein
MLSTRFQFNKLLFTSIYLVSSYLLLGQYRSYRPREFEATIKFFNKHKNEFRKCSRGTQLNSKQIFCIVAPEICEFNVVGDFLESNSLKVLYVQNGASYADFSIGYFQMKPSFVEKLEQEINKDSHLKIKFKHMLIASDDAKTKRKERIRRLENLHWQFRYLRLFAVVFERAFKFKNHSNYNKYDKLKFYGTAYNCGFYKTNKEVESEMQKSRFPRLSDKKFNYSNVCIEFFNALSN